jgi:hypothetical protein
MGAVSDEPLLARIPGADRHELAGVVVDVVPAGAGRIKRAIYPPGFRWSERLKDLVGTDVCMHAHVGFLARGRVEGTYEDGCTFSYAAPAAVVIEPGHDAWVVGDEPAVLIEFDFERETVERFGLPERHRH